jgi:hypothetical protein
MDWGTFTAALNAWTVAPLNNGTLVFIAVGIFLAWLAERRSG